ncbi:MAG: MBL fold metallo-hydrolase [Parcubacteria group bacterium]|nr:MBL fold metallo-hydrolase [Parcubacteria group bacterium]|tara:strand:- start:749 stop:1705 length:957 start_codon:yes stop_codon:yes gene_type:complete
MDDSRKIGLLSIILISAFFAVQGLFGIEAYSYEEGSLYVHVMDVGQGDAILIHTPQGKNILIDGGPHDNIREPLSDIFGFGLHTIDEIYLTHPHSDHFSGLITVMKKYFVEKVWYTGVVHTTPVFKEFLGEIKNQEIPLKLAESKETRSIDGVTIEIIYPDRNIQEKKDWVEDENGLNDTSIVMKVIYGETSFLLVGDAEKALEDYLLQQHAAVVIPAKAGIQEELDSIASLQNDEFLKADVLKIGHHGSKTSTQKKFLEVVNPEFAAISYGENSYGHPHPSVINRLNKKGVQYFETQKNGTITFISDGYEIQTIVER